MEVKNNILLVRQHQRIVFARVEKYIKKPETPNTAAGVVKYLILDRDKLAMENSELRATVDRLNAIIDKLAK